MPTPPSELGQTAVFVFTLLMAGLIFVWRYHTTQVSKIETKYEEIIAKQRENYERVIDKQKADMEYVHKREIELHKEITELKQEIGSLRTRVEMLDNRRKPKGDATTT